MSLRQDRRSFLRQAIGAVSAGLVVPLLAACTPTASQPAAAPTTAPAAGSGVTKVSYAYASPNGLHFVATVGGEKPDLPHKFGVEFDLGTGAQAEVAEAVGRAIGDRGLPVRLPFYRVAYTAARLGYAVLAGAS